MKTLTLTRTLTLTTTLALAFAVVGCKDERKTACPPVYGGFKWEWKGDSLFVTAVQVKKGTLLNGTDYRFELPIRMTNEADPNSWLDTTLVSRLHTNYDGTYSGNPVGGFRIPAGVEPGTYTCSFTATFSNSADGEMGGPWMAEAKDCKGTIRSYSYTLYSTASGSVNIPIGQ